MAIVASTYFLRQAKDCVSMVSILTFLLHEHVHTHIYVYI